MANFWHNKYLGAKERIKELEDETFQLRLKLNNCLKKKLPSKKSPTVGDLRKVVISDCLDRINDLEIINKRLTKELKRQEKGGAGTARFCKEEAELIKPFVQLVKSGFIVDQKGLRKTVKLIKEALEYLHYKKPYRFDKKDEELLKKMSFLLGNVKSGFGVAQKTTQKTTEDKL